MKITAILICVIICSIILFAFLYVCVVKRLDEKDKFNAKKANIYVGMPEKELLVKCGTPQRVIVIDETCKLICYTFDEWKGFLFGVSKHHEITVTVRNEEVTSVAK